MPPTRFAEVKSDTPNLYEGLCMHGGTLNRLSELLQTSYTLNGNQNGLYDLHIASNPLYDSQNGHTKLHGFYKHRSPNGHSEHLKASYALCSNETDSPIFNYLRISRRPIHACR